MNRVNVVIVKMVVFSVLFGGMLLGATTRASAAPAGCSERGHLTCHSYSTVQPCVAIKIIGKQCSAEKHPLGEHPWSGCILCVPYKNCHHAKGTWEDVDCVHYCTNSEIPKHTTETSHYGWSRKDSIGAECP